MINQTSGAWDEQVSNGRINQISRSVMKIERKRENRQLGQIRQLSVYRYSVGMIS